MPQAAVSAPHGGLWAGAPSQGQGPSTPGPGRDPCSAWYRARNPVSQARGTLCPAQSQVPVFWTRDGPSAPCSLVHNLAPSCPTQSTGCATNAAMHQTLALSRLSPLLRIDTRISDDMHSIQNWCIGACSKCFRVCCLICSVKNKLWMEYFDTVLPINIFKAEVQSAYIL